MPVSVPRVLAVAGLAATVGLGTTAFGARPAAPPPAVPPQTAWVAAQQGIVPVTTATGKAGPSISPKDAGRSFDLATSRNGKTVYAAADRYVALISAATRKVTRRIVVAGSNPGDDVGSLLVVPDGATLYAQAVIGNGRPYLVPVSTRTEKAGTPIPLPCQSQGAMAITPNGATIYDLCPLNNTVVPVSTRTRKAGKPIKVGDFPQDVAVTPNGKTVYVTATVSGGASPGVLDPITTATSKAGKPIIVGGFPQDVVITPNGRTAFVTNYTTDNVTPVTTATDKAGPAIMVQAAPMAEALTPDGKTLYVANNVSDTVTPVNVTTRKAGQPVPTGLGPVDVAINPNGKTVYVASGGDGHADAHKITLIRVATNTAEKRIPIGTDADYIVFTP